MKIAKVKVTPPAHLAKAAPRGKKFVKIGYVKGLIVSEDDPRVKGCVEIFDSEPALKSKMEKRKKIWAHYEFNYAINDDIKSQYESFFSGFLYYYDTELRNGLIDHTLLCHWDSKGGKDSVTVFIDPAPVRQLAISDKAKAKTVLAAAMEQNEKISDAMKNWPPPSVSSLQSDPPSPTGPPPPAP